MISKKTKLYQLLYTSIAVVLSIVFAYGVQVALQSLGVNEAAGKLIFAFVLPVILISLQIVVRWMIKRYDPETIPLVYKVKLSPKVIEPLRVLKQRLGERLDKDYSIKQFDLYVLDWQKNVFLNLFSGQQLNQAGLHALPSTHALIKFAKECRTVYMTERHLPVEDHLSDAMLGEIIIFMRRHHYAFAIPLTTSTDVFGYIFVTLQEFKDTKAFAMQSFTNLEKLSADFGSLLQQILVYDAIVLNSANYKKI